MINYALKEGLILDQNPKEIQQTLALSVTEISHSQYGRILFHLIILIHKFSYTWKEPKREASPSVISAMKGNRKVSILHTFSTLDELYINRSGARDCVMNEYSKRRK